MKKGKVIIPLVGKVDERRIEKDTLKYISYLLKELESYRSRTFATPPLSFFGGRKFVDYFEKEEQFTNDLTQNIIGEHNVESVVFLDTHNLRLLVDMDTVVNFFEKFLKVTRMRTVGACAYADGEVPERLKPALEKDEFDRSSLTYSINVREYLGLSQIDMKQEFKNFKR